MSNFTDYLVKHGVANALVAELLTIAVDELTDVIRETEMFLCEFERDDAASDDLRLVQAQRNHLLYERSVLAAECDRTTEVVASVFGQQAVKRGDVRAAIEQTLDEVLRRDLRS